jgi:cell division protein FtsQ
MKENDETRNVSTRKRKKRKKKRYLLKITICALLGVGTYFFLTSAFFDIRHIQVENNEYYTAEQVVDKAGVRIGDNLFKGPVNQIKEQLRADPYIMTVNVRRTPPATLVVRVTERREAAFLSLGGRYVIIDQDGLVLRETEVAPTLTELSSLHATRTDVGRPLEAEENPAFADTLNLLKEAKNHELYFKKIDISNIIIRAYVYDHLICEGTPENFSASLRYLKTFLLELDAKEINRGMVKIGGGGYLVWQPVTE